MPSCSVNAATHDESAILAAAVAARSAGLSWRQIESQLLSAGIKMSHVTLRAKLIQIDKEPTSQVITRAALIGFLLPVIAERRVAGLTMREVAAELTSAGFHITTDSLRFYVGKAKSGLNKKN